MTPKRRPGPVAFVLGGGGVLGAHEVGMLRALAESAIEPDVILGTSVGAINGAVFAAEPSVEGVRHLSQLWRESNASELSAGSLLRRVTTLARTGTHVLSFDELHQRLAAVFPVGRVEELQVPFQCVAASIERAAVLLVDLLLSGFKRLPSVVFKDTLAVDPCVDLIGHRLPHAVLDTSDREECEARIETVASELGDRGVLLLFPEGANFTAQRRRLAIGKLWRTGRRHEAASAQRMPHVLPPRPSGVLAALRGNLTADVIFAAPTGLGLAAFPRDLWHHTPIGRTLKTRMWLVPATDRPRDPEAQVRWIYDWWQRMDAWIESQGDEPQSGQARERNPLRPAERGRSGSRASRSSP